MTNAESARAYRSRVQENPEKKEKKNQYQRDWRAAHPGKSKEYNAKRTPDKLREWNRRSKLKNTYGLTEADFESLLVKQGGVCAICKGPPIGKGNVYHVDHDHVTGRIRGLLCHACNLGLGGFRDNQESLLVAIEYLKGLL